MAEVTLYTRRNCHLCDKALAALKEAGVIPRQVDIDTDPQLQARFTNDVPVIYVDGVEAFRHRVRADEFVSYLESRRKPLTLSAETCIPCRGGVPPLRGEELDAVARELGGSWKIVDEHHLEKEFPFPDFAQALAFTNAVGAIAEEQGHHPDIHLAWGKVRIAIWTHKIDGLTRSDFVLAAKIDQIG